FVTELDYVQACLLGRQCGLLVSVSAIHPGHSLALFEAGQTGDSDRLRAMLSDLSRIREQAIATGIRSNGHMDGTFDKLYARLFDPDFPLRLQSPYEGSRSAEFDAFVQWLKTEYPQWVRA
ncbi:MAG: hypothetical protein K9N51_11260, partial [Candidatus Pacebacteria bacterium]|nr:hypothetical protein [Candidatus Paceibacterota bacterium]